MSLLKTKKNKNVGDVSGLLNKNASLATARMGPSLSLKGDLSGEEDLTIDGQFQGTINLSENTLVIDQKGRVEADIRAKNIIIKGNVKGNISAIEKVYIHENAHVTGDITASKISVMNGAHFEGSAKIKLPGVDTQEIEFPKEEPQPAAKKDDYIIEDEIY